MTAGIIGETIELLNKFNATMVLHDFPKGKVSTITTNPNFVYMRFHGPTGNYRDSYGDKALDEKAKDIFQLLKTGKDLYAYFNNTAGSAFENARYLQSKVNSLLHVPEGK